MVLPSPLVNVAQGGDAATMMTTDEQLNFYRFRFGRTMTATDLAAFSRDLETCNLDVMSGALKQAEAAALAAKKPTRDARGAVMAQYERGVAQLAQLFPVFFVFESAWRTFAAATLRGIYQGDNWWHGVRDAVAQGAEVTGISHLGGRPAAGEMVRTIGHALKNVSSCSDLSTTYELVEICSLYHLSKLLEYHWAEFIQRLNAETALGAPTWGAFEGLFRRVRHARNNAYHHRVVSGRAEVVAAAEQLLDLLDVHLGGRQARITGQVLAPLQFTLPELARHC